MRMAEKRVFTYCLSKVILRQPPTGMACDGVMVIVNVDYESVVVGEADMATPA
jgi:hypothetical protein